MATKQIYATGVSVVSGTWNATNKINVNDNDPMYFYGSQGQTWEIYTTFPNSVIPTGATINSVTSRIRAAASQSDYYNIMTTLFYYNTSARTGGRNNSITNTSFMNFDDYATGIYSVAELNSTLVKVLIQFTLQIGSGTLFYIDSVSLIIDYTEVTPITGIGVITGTARVGSLLTAGALVPSGATASYQWASCATVGGTYVAISGATTNTYTPVVDDVGKYLKVLATGTGSYSGSAFSAATGVITGLGPINLKTYNTVPIANIKTINGIAIANVKSLNTNT